MTSAEIGQLAITARQLRVRTDAMHREVVNNQQGWGTWKELEAQAIAAEAALATAVDQYIAENRL